MYVKCDKLKNQLQLGKGIKYALLLNKVFMIDFFSQFNPTLVSSWQEMQETRRPLLGLTLPLGPIQLSL